MWRLAQPADDDSLVEMCLRLFAEDPGPLRVPAGNMRATLATLRGDPARGCAVVLDIEGELCGYALLIAFWSNHFRGTVCEVDELFVVPEHRNQGHASSLFTALAQGDLLPTSMVAIALGVSPDNLRARRLYERLGFAEAGITMVRRLG
jgi:ribosomal protein S18 acetylase RimI-like enzyme